jgi:hypothetical protein
MKRSELLNYISEELKLDVVDNQKLTNFLNENKDIDESEFYKKLQEKFPWLEYEFSCNQAYRLRQIDNCLQFFKIIAVVLIIIGIVVTLIVLSN